MSPPFDLLVVGRPSVDVMFSGLHDWPTLGTDIDADGLGICAGTAFNTPAAANRIGLNVAYVATVGDDTWSRLIVDEWDAEGLPRDFLEIEERPLPAMSVARTGVPRTSTTGGSTLVHSRWRHGSTPGTCTSTWTRRRHWRRSPATAA
jgi:sugar/nucleoside kinase (ribokinase family)